MYVKHDIDLLQLQLFNKSLNCCRLTWFEKKLYVKIPLKQYRKILVQQQRYGSSPPHKIVSLSRQEEEEEIW